MRKIIALLVLGLFLWPLMIEAREINVPIKIVQFNDGGVPTWPQAVAVVISDADSQLTAGSKSWTDIAVTYDTTSMSPGDIFYNRGLDTTITVNTSRHEVTIHYIIQYYSGNLDYVNDYYELPYRQGYGLKTCYLIVKDTSGTDEVVQDAKVTLRSMARHYMSHQYSLSNGVTIFALDSADTFIVETRKAGYYFPEDTVAIGLSTLYYLSGYDTDSTTLCRTWAYLADLGANPSENVRVVAELKSSRRVFNTCDSTWITEAHRWSGYSDANGLIEIYLSKSSCLGDKKYRFWLYRGNEPSEIGTYTVPDQGDWQIGS